MTDNTNSNRHDIIAAAVQNFLSKNEKFARLGNDLVSYFDKEIFMPEFDSAESAANFLDKCYIALSPLALLRSIVGDEKAVDSVLSYSGYIKFATATEQQQAKLLQIAGAKRFHEDCKRLVADFMHEKMDSLGIKKEYGEYFCTTYKLDYKTSTGKVRHFYLLHQNF